MKESTAGRFLPVMVKLVLASFVFVACDANPADRIPDRVPVEAVLIRLGGNAVSGPIPMTTGGANVTLAAQVLPSAATNPAVTWESSSTSTVSVSNGVLTAHAAGNATITVRTVDGDFTDNVVVNVSQPPQLGSGNVTIGFAEFQDMAPGASDILGDLTVSLQTGGSISINGLPASTTVRWYLDGERIYTGATLELTHENLGLQLGTRFVTAVVVLDGAMYSRRIRLTVEL